MPNEIVEAEPNEDALHPNAPPKTAVVGYNPGDSEQDKDPIVMIIENVAYCDGSGSPDYVE